MSENQHNKHIYNKFRKVVKRLNKRKVPITPQSQNQGGGESSPNSDSINNYLSEIQPSSIVNFHDSSISTHEDDFHEILPSPSPSLNNPNDNVLQIQSIEGGDASLTSTNSISQNDSHSIIGSKVTSVELILLKYIKSLITFLQNNKSW